MFAVVRVRLPPRLTAVELIVMLEFTSAEFGILVSEAPEPANRVAVTVPITCNGVSGSVFHLHPHDYS